ncbi:MAG: 3'-5' exonuclease [Chloroflexota bacterium]|nr:MAG: 3'-5' exonuclease [Chloroflexota bacterium]
MNKPVSEEMYVSVDVETAGPNPGQYSLLSIGACLVYEPERTFYVELKPVNEAMLPEAAEVHGLSLEYLIERGLPPRQAMERFEAWLGSQIRSASLAYTRRRPVFVAFNAPFDWMFVDDYFHRFLGRNPFGHTALDIKAYYMGLAGVRWYETSYKLLGARYLGPDHSLQHHALQDAIDQAAIFRFLLDEANRERKESHE